MLKKQRDIEIPFVPFLLAGYLGGVFSVSYTHLVIFKEQLTALVKKILAKITKQSNAI